MRNIRIILWLLLITAGAIAWNKVMAFNKFTLNKKKFLREAMYYEKLPNGLVKCQLCFRNCVIPEGKRGFCRNRENHKGKLYNIVYARPSAVHIDPIEKEPQLHMLPGTEILCIGSAGCNFRCKHCHNWHLSQRSIEEMEIVYNHKM
jgi:pyruvate formate lyase activating enzyme